MLARSGLLHVENVFSPTTQPSGFPWGQSGLFGQALNVFVAVQYFSIFDISSFVPLQPTTVRCPCNHIPYRFCYNFDVTSDLDAMQFKLSFPRFIQPPPLWRRDFPSFYIAPSPVLEGFFFAFPFFCVILSNQFLLRIEYLSFPRKRESSFFALDPCFRRGDIVCFCFPQQILTKYGNTKGRNTSSNGPFVIPAQAGIHNSLP